MGRSHSLRPPVRGCGGPRRQEEKEEAASPSAHPTPTSGPRGPANRMEVEAGRVGSARQHGPGSSLASWGVRVCSKKDPVNVGQALGKEAGKAAVETSPVKFVLGAFSRQ